MDLKSFREDKLKIKSQAEFAELIGVEQSLISKWEKEPNTIPLELINKITQKTGTNIIEVTSWEKPVPEPIKVKDTWEKVAFTKHTLSDYIANALKKMDLPEEQRIAYVDELNAGITANLVKPKVAIVGRSDTGKSTLINALLGSDKMPTSWTPTTSIAVYIKHVSDKPAFIKEDAWVFANKHDNENMWDERKLYDEDYCRSWKIAAGGTEILTAFGTRQGENYDKEAGAAVIFLDAPVLKTCDIVDLPGFGTETESDDNITFTATKKAEVIIYLSQANGFMRIEDITYLKRNISELQVWEKKGENTLKPLSNIFIVASQAHTVNSGNRKQLTKILDVGCKNLVKTLPAGYWHNRAKESGYYYSAEGQRELRSRFFTYTTDIPDLCKSFNDELTQLLETLPTIINERTKKFVHQYVAARKPALIKEIQKYDGLVAERDKYVSLLNEIENNELARIRDNDTRKKDIRAEINKLRDKSISEFNEYVATVVSVDNLVTLMKKKGVKKKEEDVELFGSFLQSEIQAKCESILKSKSEVLSTKTKEYIDVYAKSIAKPFEKTSINIDFNAEWEFVSALCSLGTICGLGTFLTTTTYGGVILTSLGSLGTAIKFLGPIGMAVGLLLTAVLTLILLFSGGWEKNVAKNIVEVFEKEDINGKFRSLINKYWDQTEAEFNTAAAKLDKKWNNYVDNLRNTINSYDMKNIQQQIATCRSLSDFFENIPLSNTGSHTFTTGITKKEI